MTRLLLVCLGGMLLLLPMRSQAEPVASAPSGEAAECQELQKLCKAARRQAGLIRKQQAKVGRKIDAQHRAEQKRTATWQKWRKMQERPHAAPAEAVQSVQKYERAAEKEGQATHSERQAEENHNAEVQRYQERVQAAQEAAAAIRAKHATMPTCFQPCADVLNLEELQ
jgi:membrane-bound lytic murein transglycosylase